MTGRARADQVARRVNAAVALLDGGSSVAEATVVLARRFRVSQRQARRYIDQAMESGEVVVPSPKAVFTVKLPRNLIRQLKQYAGSRRETLSGVVSQALEEFLSKKRPRRGGG